MTRPLLLPGPLQRRVERLAAAMLAPPGAPEVDFSRPEGEPALAPPDSVSWAVFKNPVTLFVGGVAAVILELAEPRVRHGVWDHSDFRTDPLARLRRTGLAAMVTVYGPRSAAEAMIGAVNRAHGEVSGTTPAGARYRADDPELLAWVQATAAWGFLEAWAAFVRPVPRVDRDLYYAEAVPAARLYGVPDPPRSEAEVDALFAAMAPKLEPSATLIEFLRIVGRVPAFPAAARPFQRLLVRAAIGLVPPAIAARLRLPPGLAAWQRPLVARAARLADRLPLRTAPPARACRRLGLAEDWLYRR